MVLWRLLTLAFTRFFGIQAGEARSEMAQSWEMYFLQVNGVPSSVVVDLALREVAPISDRPQLLWVKLHLNAPAQPDGLPSADEQPELLKIADDLTPAIKSQCRAQFVGSLTGGGRQNFFFYAADGTCLEPAVREVMGHFPAYRFEIGQQAEPTWMTYLELLYPRPQEMTIISNRRFFDILEQRGYADAVLRKIDHTACFKSAKARQQFAEEIEKQSFAISDEYEEDGADIIFQFALEFERVDKLQREVIDAVTWQLEELVAKHEGMYEDWGTLVRKEQ